MHRRLLRGARSFVTSVAFGTTNRLPSPYLARARVVIKRRLRVAGFYPAWNATTAELSAMLRKVTKIRENTFG